MNESKKKSNINVTILKRSPKKQTFQMVLVIKNPLANAGDIETQVRSLD